MCTVLWYIGNLASFGPTYMFSSVHGSKASWTNTLVTVQVYSILLLQLLTLYHDPMASWYLYSEGL